MNLGRNGSVIRVAGCSWLVLLACGGISERGGSAENSGGSASGGSASGGSTRKPSGGGSPSLSHAGKQAVAGAAVAIAGTGMTMPTPNTNPTPCFNDTDCPVNSCGGEVCNWTKPHPQPSGEKYYVCNPAGTDPKGEDGWCTSDANCKCLGLGAKCMGVRCSFTRASDAPGG